METEN